MRSIAIITSTRAEYGLLKPLMEQLHQDKEIELRIVVTGMHLSHAFGNTIDEIHADGFLIDECIEILFDSYLL